MNIIYDTVIRIFRLAGRANGQKCILAVDHQIGIHLNSAASVPMDVGAASGLVAAAVKTVEVKAPEAAERKLDVKDAADDGAIEAFAAAIKAAL